MTYAQILREALQAYSQDIHGVAPAWVYGTELTDVCLDGWFDLEAVAQTMLGEKLMPNGPSPWDLYRKEEAKNAQLRERNAELLAALKEVHLRFVDHQWVRDTADYIEARRKAAEQAEAAIANAEGKKR